MSCQYYHSLYLLFNIGKSQCPVSNTALFISHLTLESHNVMSVLPLSLSLYLLFNIGKSQRPVSITALFISYLTLEGHNVMSTTCLLDCFTAGKSIDTCQGCQVDPCRWCRREGCRLGRVRLTGHCSWIHSLPVVWVAEMWVGKGKGYTH